MKNRILLTAFTLFFAAIAITSCSKEKIEEIANRHSGDNGRSSGQSSSSSDHSSSSDYGSCSDHDDDNSGSGSHN